MFRPAGSSVRWAAVYLSVGLDVFLFDALCVCNLCILYHDQQQCYLDVQYVLLGGVSATRSRPAAAADMVKHTTQLIQRGSPLTPKAHRVRFSEYMRPGRLARQAYATDRSHPSHTASEGSVYCPLSY